MKLAIINGSPRNRNSNSKILTDNFLEGYSKVSNDDVPVCYLANAKMKEEVFEVFQNAEIVIIIFPLYTDCMPGIVKEFFENIAAKNYSPAKKIGFIVQSGFPEAIHSVYVERYLAKLTGRLHCDYLGTIIKGGVEGTQMMPPVMTKKLFSNFKNLGEYFAKYNAFSPAIKETLGKPYKMSFLSRAVFSAVKLTGLTNFYWDHNLKKNGAYGIRFDKPYEIRTRSQEPGAKTS